MTQPVLEINHLVKQIGAKQIIKDISFSVNEGEIFGLLGPNGAGKTTIIRSIVKLINKTSGNIKILGKDIDADYTDAIQQVGAIVENPEFYPYMTGLQNLKAFASMSRSKISNDRINEIIQLVHLEKAINNKVKTYSLGMRQRLGVAQALIHEPKLLIFDEPTNGLDPEGMKEFRLQMKALASQGVSVLVSSHLLTEMEQLCDRFAIIERGELTHIADMQQENIAEAEQLKTFHMHLEPLELSKELLTKWNIDYIVADNGTSHFFIKSSPSNIPLLVKKLVSEEISIFTIEVHTKTLEERFLELTKNNGGSME
ncbi:ABC transporter ATP-binding protein [Paenilisteria rocourtiae]|uniref:ABC-2 type transport system ATP-binding protein n=1 Tax=Listeria rocourtiae TaxID=647910 RepID=A0A4R6ZNI8_9LIST|nr:ABC transporter ATP-binding protein [Listeria rocourtiae]EUJ51173.1 sugar ABC transporter ATPase [Listeria rocourtiae FSL F6-920]MBC1434176.1 ABC transporter ATP-binding protein [Listeria rocourtiae]MBC1603701.1 ABC transporter ATP-binding protein [Listeria rocourtiae]TDR54060.1 ABC-2 type transport system ATP-binding protein [Listeria rocourtiae]